MIKVLSKALRMPTTKQRGCCRLLAASVGTRDTLLQTAFAWNENLWRFHETAQNVLQITTKMSEIGKKTEEERKNKSRFVPEGGLACVTKRKILTQPSAIMTKLTLKAKCGHTQQQSSDAEGRGKGEWQGAGVVLLVEKKKKSVAYLCHHGNAPCDSTCPSCVSQPSLGPQHSPVRQIRPR